MSDRERVEALAKVLRESDWQSGSQVSWQTATNNAARDILDSSAMRDLLAEAKADALMEAADEMVGRDGTNPHARFLRSRADMIQRTPNPYCETTTGGRDD